MCIGIYGRKKKVLVAGRAVCSADFKLRILASGVGFVDGCRMYCKYVGSIEQHPSPSPPHEDRQRTRAGGYSDNTGN